MSTEQVIAAVESLAASFRNEAYVSTTKVINPLLVLWSDGLDRDVRRRLEEFISSCLNRTLTTGEQLADFAASLRSALAVSA